MSITDGPGFRGDTGNLDVSPAYEHGAGFLLARLGSMAESDWTRFISAVGLTQAEFAVLSVLDRSVLDESARAELHGRGPEHARHDALRQGDVAARAAIDARNAVAVVARLIERGLVTAESDPADRRVKLLRIADSGVRLVSTISQQLRRERSDFFSALSIQEYARLCELLGRVYRARVSGADRMPLSRPAASEADAARDPALDGA
jgi:DNA-binding MarR family transcriptional regulator